MARWVAKMGHLPRMSLRESVENIRALNIGQSTMPINSAGLRSLGLCSWPRGGHGIFPGPQPTIGHPTLGYPPVENRLESGYIERPLNHIDRKWLTYRDSNTTYCYFYRRGGGLTYVILQSVSDSTFKLRQRMHLILAPRVGPQGPCLYLFA